MTGQATERAAAALPLRALAPAKINLGLFVGPTRADGRHELASAMQSISLADELVLEAAGPRGEAPVGISERRSGGRGVGEGRSGVGGVGEGRSGVGGIEVVCAGHPGLAGPDNLAARALVRFCEETGWEPGPLRLTIVKRVPVAAGMGGGSADAAAALRLAAYAAGGEDAGLLRRIAGELGADVPAQVAPGRWLASGAGEELEPLPPPARPFGLLVLPAAVSLSTAAVYAEADRLGIGCGGEQLASRVGQLREALLGGAQFPPVELLHNELQRAAISLCPEIGAALREAREAGADVALVSGSGPTVVGLYGGEDGPARAQKAAAKLRGRQPRPSAAVPAGCDLARVTAC